MNAKLKDEGDNNINGVGKYIFDPHARVTEGNGVEENRNMLHEFLSTTNTILANTFYDKPPQRQVTYKMDKQART